jgi:hypothetical protein
MHAWGVDSGPSEPLPSTAGMPHITELAVGAAERFRELG